MLYLRERRDESSEIKCIDELHEAENDEQKAFPGLRRSGGLRRHRFGKGALWGEITEVRARALRLVVWYLSPV